jgi:hypothetical protein
MVSWPLQGKASHMVSTTIKASETVHNNFHGPLRTQDLEGSTTRLVERVEHCLPGP